MDDFSSWETRDAAELAEDVLPSLRSRRRTWKSEESGGGLDAGPSVSFAASKDARVTERVRPSLTEV
jgi:hypothetical protein